MSNFASYLWIPSVTGATAQIAQTQTLADAGNLSLNGSLVSNGVVSLTNIARSVAIRSTNNLSGIQVIVTGTYFGFPVTSSFAGPNVNTINSPIFFDTITNIAVSGAANAISVGLGMTGQTAWFNINEYSDQDIITSMNILSTANTVNYSIRMGQEKFNLSSVKFAADGTISSPYMGILGTVNQVASSYTSNQFTGKYMTINILMAASNPTTIAGNFLATIYQPYGRRAA